MNTIVPITVSTLTAKINLIIADLNYRFENGFWETLLQRMCGYMEVII